MRNTAWLRYDIALHEAAHTVVAQKLDLPVAWVTIDQGEDEGICFTGAMKLPNELIDMERDREAICVSLAAPSFIHTGNEEINRWARAERSLALELAGSNGIDADGIYDRAEALVDEHRPEIIDLARRLREEGTVEFVAA